MAKVSFVNSKLKIIIKKKIILSRGKRPDEVESLFLEKVSQTKTYGAEIVIVRVWLFTN